MHDAGFIIKFQMISLELYFCPNGLPRSIQVWIKLNSHGKIIKKLEITNAKIQLCERNEKKFECE